jgi:hypothetical protein
MNPKILRRYTDLPSLIDILVNKRITLLDPNSWDDKNDSHYISVYKENKNLKTVLALCFTKAAETYHHWKVFSGNTGGVCIVFDRNALLAAIKKESGVRCRTVKYHTLQANKQNPPLSTSILPFIKRHAFRHELEYRVIFESTAEILSYRHLTIPLSSISRVIISPWLPISLADSTRCTLRAIDGCERLEIARSTLVNNEQWKKIANNML